MKEVEVDGWKGKDSIEVFDAEDDYILIEHRKNKESGQVTEERTIVKKERVDVLWQLIKDNCGLNIKYGYRFIIRLILNNYKFHEKAGMPLEFFMESFNGGGNRASYYFPFYYHPVKILEGLGKIKYYGNGSIEKLV